MVELVADDFALFIELDFDISESGGRLRGPLKILGTHPLDANGFADGLREDYGFIFRASIASVRSAVMPRSGMSVNNDEIGRDAKHHGDFTAKRLRVLIVRMNVNRSIGLHIRNGHGSANGRVLHERKLVGGGKFPFGGSKRGGNIDL